MIQGFSEQTKPLTPYENDVILPLILQGFYAKIGKEKAITNQQICSTLKKLGYKVDNARLRKIINHIRVNGMVIGLIATSEGYYIAETRKELEVYLKVWKVEKERYTLLGRVWKDNCNYMSNKIQIQKINGLFNLRPLYDLFSQSIDGVYQVVVKKVRKPRSNDQNGWLWGCIYPMLLEALLDAGWEFVTVDQVHEFFKSQMTADQVVNKHTGEIITFPGSTATMDTLTFSTYCEKLREYALEYLNLEIPDPDPNWRIADEKDP